jgi:hypothetical protein
MRWSQPEGQELKVSPFSRHSSVDQITIKPNHRMTGFWLHFELQIIMVVQEPLAQTQCDCIMLYSYLCIWPFQKSSCQHFGSIVDLRAIELFGTTELFVLISTGLCAGM